MNYPYFTKIQLDAFIVEMSEKYPSLTFEPRQKSILLLHSLEKADQWYAAIQLGGYTIATINNAHHFEALVQVAFLIVGDTQPHSYADERIEFVPRICLDCETPIEVGTLCEQCSTVELACTGCGTIQQRGLLVRTPTGLLCPLCEDPRHEVCQTSIEQGTARP